VPDTFVPCLAAISWEKEHLEEYNFHVMTESEVYLLPSKRVLSIERARPGTQNRAGFPKCGSDGCSSRADYTIKIGDEAGVGYVDRCVTHFERELQDARFSAKVLNKLVEKSLPIF
jgi:hypothetical protein